MRLSILLPIFDEREKLEENLPKIYEAARKFGDFEIIVAEDGSTDGSKELAESFSRRLKRVRVISKKERRGRGAALKDAIRLARGKTICYMDIDLSVPLKFMDSAIYEVEHGAKFVTGSRYVHGSKIRRSPYRWISSRSYNLILKLLFDSKVHDHQCGFKFWDAKFLKGSIRDVKDNRWFFDSELILRSERKGIEIVELPVEWRENDNSKVRASDISYFLAQALRLRFTTG